MDLISAARGARRWGRPVTDEEADSLLAEVDRLRAMPTRALDEASRVHSDWELAKNVAQRILGEA